VHPAFLGHPALGETTRPSSMGREGFEPSALGSRVGAGGPLELLVTERSTLRGSLFLMRPGAFQSQLQSGLLHE